MISLDKLYLESSIQKKRQIIGSIFPEKLSLDENESRIDRINGVVNLIYVLNMGFSETTKSESRQNIAGSRPSDPARARTEDPKIKSLLLYQLSYGVKIGVANIHGIYFAESI